MYSGRTAFAQLTDYLPKRRFQPLVNRYRDDYKNRKFTCLDQLFTMLFAQLTYCERRQASCSCWRCSSPGSPRPVLPKSSRRPP